MEHIVGILKYIENSSFLSSLLSGLLVAGLFGLLFPYYFEYKKKPKNLELFFRDNGTDTLGFNKDESGKLSYSIELAFRHAHGQAFYNHIYWHIYIPKFLNPIATSLGPNTLPTTRIEENDDGVFVHFSGKITEQVFPETTHWFHYKFTGSIEDNQVQIENKQKITIYYFNSTEYGNYPKKLKIDINNGLVDVKKAGRLYLSI